MRQLGLPVSILRIASVILVENNFHSNVSFGLMAKAYHALVGTFAPR